MGEGGRGRGGDPRVTRNLEEGSATNYVKLRREELFVFVFDLDINIML